jgi:glycosyltransferase involved in cell wall biosynthesis
MLSVVIPLYNNEDQLGAQLNAVLGQRVDEDFEVVVADNGSTDGSREAVERYRAADSRVRLVDASRRRGPGAARNEGVKATVSEKLFFCDADDIVHEGWLAGLLEGLAHADIVVGALDVWSFQGSPQHPYTDPTPTQFRFLPAGLGANMAVKREAFEAMGGFNEELRVGEDIDLCWRMQLSGRPFELRMDAAVAKRPRETGKRLIAQSLSYGRSDVALYRRFRHAGMPRRPAHAVKVWGWITLNVWTVAWAGRRRVWSEALFIQLGRLLGSWQQRVFYP